jgi:hypothetical protein
MKIKAYIYIVLARSSLTCTSWVGHSQPNLITGQVNRLAANVREMFTQSCYKNDVIIIHLNSTKWIILQRKRRAETYLVAVRDEDEVRVTVSGWSDDTSMMNAKAFSSVIARLGLFVLLNNAESITWDALSPV